MLAAAPAAPPAAAASGPLRRKPIAVPARLADAPVAISVALSMRRRTPARLGSPTSERLVKSFYPLERIGLGVASNPSICVQVALSMLTLVRKQSAVAVREGEGWRSRSAPE